MAEVEEPAVIEAPTTSYPIGAMSAPLDRLVTDANPDYGVDTDAMRAGLTKVAREKAAATDVAAGRQMAAINEGRAEVKAKYDGIGPLDVKPWDATKEKEERVQSPMEAFGSAAGIFAMLASAFTKNAADNALNAGAAAINSVRANDFDGYNKAHEAFQENTKLALKKHEAEREAFNDAMALAKNDPIAGGAELKAVAARFGAKAELAMIDAGYIDKVFEIQQAKSTAAQKLIAQMPNLVKMDEAVRSTMLFRKGIEEEEAKLGRPLTAQEQAGVIGSIKEQMAVSKEKKQSPEEVATAKFIAETVASTGKEPDAATLAKFHQQWRTGKDGALGTYKGTEAQTKSIRYGTYLDRGLANLEEVKKRTGYFPSIKDMAAFELMESERREKGMKASLMAIAANFALSPEAQEFYQAAREFTAGVLRPETGAALRAGEITNTINRFIDAPGDKGRIGKQKEEARKQTREATWVGSGLPPSAWGLDRSKGALSGVPLDADPAIMPSTSTAPVSTPPLEKLNDKLPTKFKNGQSWILRDGKAVRVDQ